MRDIKGSHFFCSWSGGKDSCLALYRAVRGGGVPRFLITTLHEGEEASRGHRLPAGLVRRQASSLGIPLVTPATSWEGYEASFTSVLAGLREEGVEAGVFGDIDLEAHREWVIRICSSLGMDTCLPLWGERRGDLLDELLGAGFKATIVAVRDGVLDRRFLGRTLDDALLEEFAELGIDASGEEGEYHTVVTDGPIFASPVPLEASGEYYLKDDFSDYGSWYLGLAP